MRKLLITLAVLLVILVGLDIGGRLFAENKLASELGKQAELTVEPSIDIGGFSFLWQVVAGNYDHVTVTFPRISLEDFDDVSATVDAYGLALSIGDITDGTLDDVTAEKVTARAEVPLATLASLFEAADVSISAGSGSTLLVKSAIAAAGRTYSVTAQVTPSIRDDVLYLKADKLVELDGIPANLSTQALSGLSVQLPLDGLPVSIDRGQVSVVGQALVISAVATDVPVGSLLR